MGLMPLTDDNYRRERERQETVSDCQPLPVLLAHNRPSICLEFVCEYVGDATADAVNEFAVTGVRKVGLGNHAAVLLEPAAIKLPHNDLDPIARWLFVAEDLADYVIHGRPFSAKPGRLEPFDEAFMTPSSRLGRWASVQEI